MRRKLFTLAAGVSAVVFLIMVACHNGIGTSRGVAYTKRDRTCYFLGLYGGGLRLVKCVNRPDGPTGLHTFHYSTAQPYAWGSYVFNPENPDTEWFGVGVGTTTFTRRGWPRSSVAHFVIVEYWLIIPFAAVLPGVWVWSRARIRSRPRRGLCVHCGYDLRATPDRCPECGAVPAAKGERA